MITFISLTPASISFLTQFILALAISLFLARHLRTHRTPQLTLLTAFFVLGTMFVGLMFLDAALSPYPRLFAVYAENTVLALGLVFLIQFAYRFPQSYPRRKWESYAALAVSLGYFLWEGGFMVYRYIELLGWETVHYRPGSLSYATAVVLLWAPVAFTRQCIAADTRSTENRPASWPRKLWQPQGKGARGARAFVFVFGILFVLGLINLGRDYLLVSTTFYNISLSIGVLVVLWLFAYNYINFIPGGISVQVKLSVLTLTIFLALLGSVAWLIAPPYIAAFQPNLTDHQTLRFTPIASGGYEVAEIPFSFESELGEKVQIGFKQETQNHKIDFNFPFYGQLYNQVYIASSGAISMGESFIQSNMQANLANAPAIFPLLIELDPNGGGGLYARADTDRLVVTWDHLPALYRPQAFFTFQAVLHSDGIFEITYNGLPLPFTFDPDTTPSANPWMRGIVSGQGEPLHTNAADLLTTARDGQSPLIENYQLAFRRYLHAFMLPLAGIVFGGSLLLMIGLPLLLRASIISPLEALSAGVRQMEEGNLTVTIPIQNEDEIGYLTGAFNTMAARLDVLVTGLEARVMARTVELGAANRSLTAEMKVLVEAQIQILEQQRELAALDERARLSRDLHDGLGQVLSYINVQAAAVQAMLENEQTAEAQTNLRQLIQAAQDATTDFRNHLLDLRRDEEQASSIPPKDLLDTLPAYLAQFQDQHGLEVHLRKPENLTGQLLNPNVDEQAARIIQETFTNVAKHAQASRVDINFQASGDQVQITVTDDGVGFQPVNGIQSLVTSLQSLVPSSQSPVPGHYGLQIMHERAEKVGGQLEIRSAPGKGTRVSLTLPRFLQNGSDDEMAAVRGLRIVLADDHPLFLSGLHNLLMSRGLTVVGTAEDGQRAIEVVRALRPDVVVMDLNMPECDGIEATRVITSEMPEVKVVILTIPDSEDRLYEAIRGGASGYLYKDLEPNQLCQLLVGLLRGEAAFSPSIAERIMAEMGHLGEISGDMISLVKDESIASQLTARQVKILKLVAEGKVYREIAQSMYLSEATIKYHMGNILEHLHLKTRKEAEEFAKKFI